MKGFKVFSIMLGLCFGFGGLSADKIEPQKVASFSVNAKLKSEKVNDFAIIKGKVVDYKRDVVNQKADELVFVIDKSGSMYNSRQSIVEGFNEILDANKKLSIDSEKAGKEKKANITIKFFSSKVDSVRERRDVKNVEPLTLEDYVPYGCTALLDAVGETLDEILKFVPEDSKEQKPLSNVILYIMTDGAENNSKRYDDNKVIELMGKFRTLGGNVRFIGAGPWAYDQYKNVGVPLGCTINLKTNTFTAADRGMVLESCTKFRNRPM